MWPCPASSGVAEGCSACVCQLCRVQRSYLGCCSMQRQEDVLVVDTGLSMIRHQQQQQQQQQPGSQQSLA